MNIKLSARGLCAALFAMLLMGGFCGPASASQAVSSCQTLSAPGNYFLTQNLTATGDCLVIAASNVAIDLKGKTITGNGSGSGINDDGGDRDYAIIANGKIRGFDTGINLHTSGSAIISNINASNNGTEGVFIKECCNTLDSVTANNNSGTGIVIQSDDSSLSNIQANNNGSGGIFISNCCNALISSTVNNNNGVGAEIGSDDNFIVNSKLQKNSNDGVEMVDDNGVIKSNTSNNGGDGMDFSDTVNLVTATKSNGNGGTGIDMGSNRFGVISGVQANNNASDGVNMGCRGSTASLTAKNNSGTNLVQVGPPTGDGPCANVNLKAP